MRDENQCLAPATILKQAGEANIKNDQTDRSDRSDRIFLTSYKDGLHPLGNGVLVEFAHHRGRSKVCLGCTHAIGIEVRQAISKQ